MASNSSSSDGANRYKCKYCLAVYSSLEVCSEVLDFLILRAEGFSCSVEVLHGGLGIKPSSTLSKRKGFFFSFKILKFLVIKPWIHSDQKMPWIRIRHSLNVRYLPYVSYNKE
jgi:hypothetical protein